MRRLFFGSCFVLFCSFAWSQTTYLNNGKIKLVDSTIVATNVVLPNHVTLWFDEFAVVSGNPIIRAASLTTQPYNTLVYQNPPADASSCQTSFLIKAGSYTVNILGATANSYGKSDIYVDGILQTNLDWYSLLATANVVKTFSLTFASGGSHIAFFITACCT